MLAPLSREMPEENYEETVETLANDIRDKALGYNWQAYFTITEEIEELEENCDLVKGFIDEEKGCARSKVKWRRLCWRRRGIRETTERIEKLEDIVSIAKKKVDEDMAMKNIYPSKEVNTSEAELKAEGSGELVHLKAEGK